MRWSYKTVHFGLKKDGLLGGAFLDETEIEESLNGYGRSGWELVSMFETRDGVIAVFKQLLNLSVERHSEARGTRSERQVERPVISGGGQKRAYVPEPVAEEAVEVEEAEPVVGSYREDAEEIDEEAEKDDGESLIGSIRIE